MTTEAQNLINKFISVQKSFEVDAFHLQQITKAVYGGAIEMLESPNDTTHEYDVSADELEEWDKEYLANAIKNKYERYFQYGVILNDMCIKGLIEPGKYYVRMSW